MTTEEIKNRFSELTSILQKEYNPAGYWEGQLSSSALAVAVAIVALHVDDPTKHKDRIDQALNWLQANVNSDGSFGDSPTSPGNVSTSLLVYAATNLYAQSNSGVALLRQNIEDYLLSKGINVRTEQVSQAILKHYKKDYTFSVPILALCGVCGVPGPEAFKYIPQLPFELSLLPRRFYRMLNLSVVSYAIPALIAVGIVIFKKKKSTSFSRFLRKGAVRKSLRLLEKLMPESGGFLEAIPLTAFVCLSLIEAGYHDLKVVKKGIEFLENSQRPDGSWPIDIDLSTWVTTLSVKALRGFEGEVLTGDQKQKITKHLLQTQTKQIHPFNGSSSGGFGWTNFSGSVPDGDDTPGAILALLRLNNPTGVKQEVLAACNWLVQLQNGDGGLPTFSRGWGKLPFDQSCADLTGHALLAIGSTLNCFSSDLDEKTSQQLKNSFTGMLRFLNKHQQKDGSWLPLWFGNQFTSDHSNPVYGTSRVITYLQDIDTGNWMNSDDEKLLKSMIVKGISFLKRVQNSDGSWGGNLGVEGTIEETALAISALCKVDKEAASTGMRWLDLYYKQNGLVAAPIGLYFASLWYDERLYPLTSYLEACSRILEADAV